MSKRMRKNIGMPNGTMETMAERTEKGIEKGIIKGMMKKPLSLFLVLTLLTGLIGASVVYAAGLQDTEAGNSIRREFKNEAWDALSDAEKNELYAAKEAVDAAQKALYDKAAAVGLIDEETAEAMKASTDESTARMKTNDLSPISGFRVKMNFSKEEGNKTDKTDWPTRTLEDLPLIPQGRGDRFFKRDGDEAAEFNWEEWLQQAVAEDKITQEEADQIRAWFEKRSEYFGERIKDFFTE